MVKREQKKGVETTPFSQAQTRLTSLLTTEGANQGALLDALHNASATIAQDLTSANTSELASRYRTLAGFSMQIADVARTNGDEAMVGKLEAFATGFTEVADMIIPPTPVSSSRAPRTPSAQRMTSRKK